MMPPVLPPEVVTEAFPRAIALDEFVAERSAWLRGHGFDPDEALAVTATCRDEFLAPLRAQVRVHWHRAFDFSSLAGLPLAGATGAAAVIGHAPQTGRRTEIVVFALPHIGVLSDGTVGQSLRRGRNEPTTACGSVAAAISWAAAGGSGQDPIDPDDPEQSLVRTRLMKEFPGLGGADMWTTTRLLRDLMMSDVWSLLTGLADPALVDIAVVSAVVIHGPDGRDYAQPSRTRIRCGGNRIEHPSTAAKST